MQPPFCIGLPSTAFHPTSLPPLQALLEKAVVLGVGVGKPAASEALCELIERYSSLLAANGQLLVALEYLNLIPGGWLEDGCSGAGKRLDEKGG